MNSDSVNQTSAQKPTISKLQHNVPGVDAANLNDLSAVVPKSGGGGGSRLSFVENNNQSNTLVASTGHHSNIPSTVKRKALLNKNPEGKKEGSLAQKRSLPGTSEAADGQQSTSKAHNSQMARKPTQ